MTRRFLGGFRLILREFRFCFLNARIGKNYTARGILDRLFLYVILAPNYQNMYILTNY